MAKAIIHRKATRTGFAHLIGIGIKAERPCPADGSVALLQRFNVYAVGRRQRPARCAAARGLALPDDHVDACRRTAFGQRLQLEPFTGHQTPKTDGGIMRAREQLHGGPRLFNPQRMGIARKASRDPVCGKAIGARPIIAQNGAFQHQRPQQVEAA